MDFCNIGRYTQHDSKDYGAEATNRPIKERSGPSSLDGSWGDPHFDAQSFPQVMRTWLDVDMLHSEIVRVQLQETWKIMLREFSLKAFRYRLLGRSNLIQFGRAACLSTSIKDDLESTYEFYDMFASPTVTEDPSIGNLMTNRQVRHPYPRVGHKGTWSTSEILYVEF